MCLDYVHGIGPNGDGEILFRGRHVFMGYLKEERKTRETIDEDGWLHSGDIGRVDPDGEWSFFPSRDNSLNLSVFCDVFTGYLYITGRIKEILITKGGENIAPVPIEVNVLDCCKLVSYCIVIGDGQRYITALVSLRCEVRPQYSVCDLAISCEEQHTHFFRYFVVHMCRFQSKRKISACVHMYVALHSLDCKITKKHAVLTSHT